LRVSSEKSSAESSQRIQELLQKSKGKTFRLLDLRVEYN
jgi:hypothetical protein